MEVSAKKKLTHIITLLALLGGLILSILSELGTCTESCSESHKYHLFGFPFPIIGIIYFSILIISAIFSKQSRNAAFFTAIMLALGIGSEFMFILLQKMSGGWCPLCLGVAITILIASFSIGYKYLLDINDAMEHRQTKEIMVSIRRSLMPIPAILAGLLIAFYGVTRIDDTKLELTALEEHMSFGDQESQIEMYVFTSWTCPACRRLEPNLERMIPNMFKLAKVTFIDFGEDMTTLNYLPYNLSFMIHNKPSYVDLRHLLKTFASDTGTPTEENVEKEVKALGLKYQQLNYSEIALAIEYYKDLAKKYNIQAIPAVVIDKNNGVKPIILTGINITMENIRKAIAIPNSAQ